MRRHENEPFVVNREVRAVIVPAGQEVKLKPGQAGYITQALGGSFTVYLEGNLFRIAGEDADAIGQEAVKPPELPGTSPLVVQAGGQGLEIAAMRADVFQGALDLVIDYKAKGVSGPVETRTQIVELMKALLAKYPELRTGFHGLWVYAHYEQGQSFAIELPMDQIQ